MSLQNYRWLVHSWKCCLFPPGNNRFDLILISNYLFFLCRYVINKYKNERRKILLQLSIVYLRSAVIFKNRHVTSFSWNIQKEASGSALVENQSRARSQKEAENLWVYRLKNKTFFWVARIHGLLSLERVATTCFYLWSPSDHRKTWPRTPQAKTWLTEIIFRCRAILLTVNIRGSTMFLASSLNG